MLQQEVRELEELHVRWGMGTAIWLNETYLADRREGSEQMRQGQEGGCRAFHGDRRMDRIAFRT